MTGGRVLHAGLQLLDRQLVDRAGRLCGKVDDLELSEPDELGNVYVQGILCGPGALLARTGHVRLGGWLRRVAAVAFPGASHDPVCIPFGRVIDISNHISLAMDREDVATFAFERWVGEHIIEHLPGSAGDAAG